MTVIVYRKLEKGFFIYAGQIYFSMPYKGWTINLPVINDKISSLPSGPPLVIPLNEEVEVLEEKDFPDHGVSSEMVKNLFFEDSSQ